MADYVFTLGLIPVQEWIAQARRSRDLRAGSVFLWHLVARLLARLRRELAGVEVWTPKVTDEELARLARQSFRDALGEPYGIPNRASG
jgi:CRISPR RNA silencing complex Cmr2 subunit-like protein